MWNRFASAVAGVALALGVGGAHAASYNVNLTNLGFLGYEEMSADLDVAHVSKWTNSFTDSFSMVLEEDSNVWFGAASLSHNIEIFSVKLYNSLNNLVAVGEEFSFGWGWFSIAGEGLGPLLLEAGGYYFLVDGENENGGSYASSSSYGYGSKHGGKKHNGPKDGMYKFGVLAEAAPPATVPLPPAALLLATGLAGLAGLARRRKASDALAATPA